MTSALNHHVVRLLVAAVSMSFVCALAGCKRSQAPAVIQPAARGAAFTPEGRWHSQKGKDMRVHLLPDGTLQMIDPRGQQHLFHRVGPERWEARISPVMNASIHREGDQLVFHADPTPEASKPIAQKNGLMIVRQIRPVDDRMTRVPEGSDLNTKTRRHEENGKK